MFSTHRQSSHAARAANWAIKIVADKCVARELMRNLKKRLKPGVDPNQHARQSLLTLRKAVWKIKRLMRRPAKKERVVDDQSPIKEQEKKVIKLMTKEIKLSY